MFFVSFCKILYTFLVSFCLVSFCNSYCESRPQNHSTISILLVCRSVRPQCYFPSPIDFPPGPSPDKICSLSKCFPAFPSPRRKALYCTKYQAVPTCTDPVPQSNSQYCHVLTQYYQLVSLYNSSSSNIQSSQLNIFSFYDSFDKLQSQYTWFQFFLIFSCHSVISTKYML